MRVTDITRGPGTAAEGESWMRKRHWPATFGEPPRRRDGTVDVTALCRQWDQAFNEGAADRPGVVEAQR